MSWLTQRFKEPVKRFILGAQPPASDAAWQVTPEELLGVSVRWPTILQWAPGEIWVEPLFHGLRARVPVTKVDIPQRLTGTVVIELLRGSRTYRVALNVSDYPDLTHLDSGPGMREDLQLEFKMQYRAGGYDSPAIVPGGYVSDALLVDWYARVPRRQRQRQEFSWDVYGRFGLQFATETRRTAIAALQEQTKVGFYGGGSKVAYPEFLAEVARSKVCLDLPGNGPFCFRLVNYFAVGACVVSVPHATIMPVPLEDRKHIIYTRPDMSDLVDLCEEYANDGAKRESVMRASHEYYRRHLYWRSLSDYYLRTMLDRLVA